MVTLETSHLYLLSAMMQTLGALWGIVFVVYVFLYEYYSRSGGWQEIAEGTIDEIKMDIERAPQEIAAYPSGRTYPSVTRRLRDGLDSIPYTRNAMVRYRRVFWQVLITGPIVLASILANVVVLTLNDTSLVSIAVGLFAVALLSLAYVLLKEVWTSISGNSRLMRRLAETGASGRKAYEEAKETIPEE